MSSHLFRDEGCSPLDALPVRITATSTPASVSRDWHAWAVARGAKDWLSSWASVAPDVGPAMLELLCALPRTSGVTWVLTSDFRDSPSHADGGAVDLAPRPGDWSRYAASRDLDPLLNARPAVLAHMLAAINTVTPPSSRAFTMYAEDDHVHVHIHSGQGSSAQLWPKRTHTHYTSLPCDEQYRLQPRSFKPRF